MTDTDVRSGTGVRDIVLVHGAATTARIWDRLLPHLTGFRVHVPDRPSSGDLETELAALAPLCAGAYVVGVSGGTTLGLALASRGVPMRAALLHEPAAGSLAPGLLTHVAAGLRTGASPVSAVHCTARAGHPPTHRPIPPRSTATSPCSARSSPNPRGQGPVPYS